MDSFRYILATLVLVALPPALIYWFIVHPFVRHWRRLGPAVTITVISVALCVLMGVLWTFRTTLLDQNYGANYTLVGAGIASAGLAIWIAYLRSEQLDMRTMLGIPELKATADAGNLVTEGIYARTRNPRYLEVFFGILGFALIANYFGSYMIVIWSVPTLHLLVLLEERELRARFGEEYVNYCQRVPRWLPLVFGGQRPSLHGPFF